MINFIHYLRKSDFVRNISIVFSGTALAQLIGLALTPIISRLFDESDFGVFGSFFSLLNIVVAGVTLQYSNAVMLPKKDEDAANIFGLSILSVIFISFIGLIVAYIFPEWLLRRMESPQSRWLLWFLPLGIFVSGLTLSFQGWCVRRKQFKKTATSQVIRSGASNILQIVTGLLKYGGGGLICSSVIANGITNLNLGHQVFVKDRKFFSSSLAWKKMRKLAYEYRDFPLYATTQNVTNSLMQGLPVLLLVYFYGTAVGGAYMFGIRIIKVPFNFVLTAFKQVFFQKASEAYNQGQKIYPLFIKTTLGLAAVSLPPSILFIFFSPILFAWVFGEQWRVAGEYAGWLTLWLMVGFCNVPSVQFARILRKQKQLFIYELIHLTFSAAGFCIGGLYFEARTTVILFSVIGMLANSILIVWIACVTKRVHDNIKI